MAKTSIKQALMPKLWGENILMLTAGKAVGRGIGGLGTKLLREFEEKIVSQDGFSMIYPIIYYSSPYKERKQGEINQQRHHVVNKNTTGISCVIRE